MYKNMLFRMGAENSNSMIKCVLTHFAIDTTLFFFILQLNNFFYILLKSFALASFPPESLSHRCLDSFFPLFPSFSFPDMHTHALCLIV